MLIPVHSNAIPVITQQGDWTHVRFFCEVDGERVEVAHITMTRHAVQGFGVGLFQHAHALFEKAQAGAADPVPFPNKTKRARKAK